MKHLLIKALLCLSSVLCIYSSYGQTQYLKANSVEGFVLSSVETSNSCQDAKYSPLSTVNSQNIVLLNNPNQECSNKTNVSFHLLNLHQTNWMRVTCTTFSEQTIGVYNIAPLTYLNRTVTLPYNANYMWKTEYVASQTPTFGSDTLRIEVNNFVANINTTDNNLNLPSGNVSYRIKAGQSYNLFTLQGTGPFTVISGAAQGTQNVIFEAFDNNIKIGEDVLTVIIGPVCNVTIDNFEPIAFGSMTYNLTLRSNISAKPYLWELRDAFGTGIVRKTGTTSANTLGIVEQISLAGIGTGTYKLFVRPVNQPYCWGSRNVAITDDQDKCTVSILNPKVQSSVFNCTISVSTNLSAMAWSLQNAKDSLITSGTSFNPSVNLQSLPAGDYVFYAKPNNFCSATYRFSWNPIAPQNESRGYLKKFNNVPDYYEIAGIGDYGGVKDAGTGWVVKENRTVMLWQTYVKALSNSPGAKALITFRQDSSSTSKHFSLAFEKGKIKVIQRSTKGGANVVSTEIATTSESTWLRFERNGNNLLCKISDSPPESDNPVFTTTATINNAFAGWTLPFWKGLYVSSGSSTTLATAEFHRFLGGPYTGTTSAIDNTPLAAPVIASSNLNPTVNASVTLSSSACKSGYLIQYYKNGLPIYQGTNYNVTVNYGDSYKAKCEKGTDKSAFSNTIAFNAPASNEICGIADGTKIGDKTQFSTVYELKARIFGGKLWLTQNLNTTPESFLVRGVNFTIGDFVKTWTGTDFSCFEGQSTGVGGLVEPTGFITPSGYTLTVQPDQAKIYTFGTGGGVSPPTLVSSPAVPTTSTSVTFTASNCTGTVTFFKNGTNLGTTNPLLVNNPVANDVYSAKCTVGSSTSASSNTITIASPVVDGGNTTALAIAPSEIVIPEETEWNRFRPEIIPAVNLPTKLDPVTGLVLPDKWFIWHSPFRNMFGYVANQNVTDPVTRLNNELTGMRRLGFMAQLWNFTEPCYETTQTFSNGTNCTFTTTQTTLDVAKEVISGENPLGYLGEDPMTFANRSYDDFIGGINYSRKPLINGKYQSLGYITDGENIYTAGNEQKDVDALGNAYYKIATDIRGYIGNQYFAPNNSLGVMSDDFFAGNNAMLSWHGTINAGVHTGKSLKNLNQIVSISEMGTYYEDMLPEGTVIKDQNNNNWFTISHFGTNVGFDIDYKKPGGANARHWAVQYGGITFKNAKDAHATGHKHLMSFKPGNQIGNGYIYSPESSAWHDGKYIKDFDLSMGPEYYNQPNVTQTPNDTPLPPYIMEGAVLLTMFEGADGIYLWNSAWNKVLHPITKTGNARTREHQVDPTRDRVPRDFYTHYLKGQSRLGQKYTFGDGTQLSFLDLVAQSDTRYLLDQTEYSIDGGTTYKKVIPLEWSRQKLPPVLMVVNDRLAKAFIYAQEAYNECSSRGITSVKVRYNSKVYTVPILPNNKPNMVGYLLSANPATDGGTVSPPVITSNPVSPVAGTAVTFSTSSQCGGTIKWYNGDAQVSSGVSYTVPNPVANDSYSATCTVGSNTSAGSNIITVANAPPASGGVTITEPNKPQYFFSNSQPPSFYANNSNLPQIFTNSNSYDPVNELVWLSNDKIKIGLNLKRGGQIAWASLLNSTTNLVYNGYDGGLQVQLDAYQKPDGYMQNGKYSRSRYSATGQYSNDPNFADAIGVIPLTSYNVTQGGDFNNHSQSLIEYRKVGTNGYYIKLRPIFYTLDAEHSRTYIEVTYTLDGYSVKCDYTYTSFRNDGQYPGNGTSGQYEGGFDAGHAPVCFLVNNLSKYKSYTGNNPWTRDNSGIEDGNLPNESSGQIPLTKNSKERWSYVYNPNNANQGVIGVYANTTETENSFSLKQKEVYNNDRQGGEFGGGYTVLGRNFDLVPFLSSFDRTNFSKNISSYLIVAPNQTDFVNTVYAKSGH
jgi:hypothetical protein